MAYGKSIANRLFNMAKSPFSSRTVTNPNPLTSKKPRDQSGSLLHRFLFQSAATSTPTITQSLYRQLPLDQLSYRSKRLQGLDYISIQETKKVLRASQTEAVRARLRESDRSCVAYSEFVEVCCEGAGGFVQGMEVAKLLDDSGAVIVLGNIVFLRPDQVARAIEGVMAPLSMPIEDEARKRELLEAMEEKKAEIDEKAEALVKKELWCGLGLFFLQTTGFMRLTFWELSWDVMEPICFYVTSFYFMAGYAFFLRTSRDPSFEGFFQSRFAAKQKRLMNAEKFDMDRFERLKKAFPASFSDSFRSSNDKTLIGVRGLDEGMRAN